MRRILAMAMVSGLLGLTVPPAAYSEDIECGFDEADFGAGGEADINCASPHMTMGIIWTTHQRVMQAPNSPWPDSAYLDGMLAMEPEFEQFVNFVSAGRTSMDVRIIKRRGADSAYAWVTLDSTRSGVRSEITSRINAGQASPQDSSFFKNADGLFFYYGRLSGTDWSPGQLVARFCSDQGEGYAVVGSINQSGTYGMLSIIGGARHFWRMGAVHEVGHMFGLNHTPNSGNIGGENISCPGCMGCFNAMDGFLNIGCPNTSHQYVPYHPLHAQRLGWADFVTITRDTTLYIRDFRVRPTVYKVKPQANRPDFFAMYNLQQTALDSVVAGEGLAITHAYDNSPTGWNSVDVWDMETPQLMYDEDGNSRCPALPHVEDTVNGVDTLQCRRGGSEMHLWPFPENSQLSFARGTNPSTKLYVANPTSPVSTQNVESWLCLTAESLADSSISGKEMIKVVINIDCGLETEGPGFASAAPVDGLQASAQALSNGVEFLLAGRKVRELDRIELYNAAGRLVRSIDLSQSFARRDGGYLLWDGKNSGGQRVASGVYFYRFIQQAGEISASGRIVVVR